MHSKLYVIFLYDDVHLAKTIKDIARHVQDKN